MTAPARIDDTVGTIRRRIALTVFALLVAMMLAVTVIVAVMFEARLAPELERYSARVAASIEAEIARALGYGIPFREMVGMEPMLAQFQADNPDVGLMVVTDEQGEVLFQRGLPAAGEQAAALRRRFRDLAGRDESANQIIGGFVTTTLVLRHDGLRLGAVHVGVAADVAGRDLVNGALDIAMVLLVAMMVSSEAVFLIVGIGLTEILRSVSALLADGARGRFTTIILHHLTDETGRLIDVLNATVAAVSDRYRAVLGRPESASALRAAESKFSFTTKVLGGYPVDNRYLFVRFAFFLFVFGDSCSTSFLPVFARDLYTPRPWLSDSAAGSLPISVYWLSGAVIQPLVGILIHRLGRRGLFIAATLISAAANLGMGLAGDIGWVIAARAAAGLGMGLALILAQDYISVSLANREGGTFAAAVYLSAFFAASVCGTSIGGVVADQIGYAPTIVASVLITLCALPPLLALRDTGDEDGPVRPAGNMAAAWQVLRNPRFLAVILFAAIPSRFLIAAFLTYLTPLYLHELGSGKAEVARVVVIYALLMAFSAPFWGRFVDRHGKPRAFIVAGMVLSGLALLLVPAWPGVAVTALGVALFGLAQASSMPAQVTLMYKVTEAECQRHGRATVLGLFRFGERLGSICGPVVMGGVVGAWGYSAGIMGAGGLALASCLVFIGLFGLLPGGSATRHGG